MPEDDFLPNNDLCLEDKLLDKKEEDTVFQGSLRPRNLSEFIGQKDIIAPLQTTVTAAKQRKDPLEHLLLSGPPGLGKTSIAHCIANEMNAKFVATSGPAIERAGDLVGILTNLEKGDIFFIDEIHRLGRVVEEFLYPAIEDFQIDFVIDKGPYAKSVKFKLKPFTLIGATTKKGMLTAPLRGRFGLFYDFDFYPTEELVFIVERSAGLLGVSINKESCWEIASRSRGTPRLCNLILKRVRDYAQVKARGVIDLEITRKALDEIKVDQEGFTQQDRKYLTTIIKFYSGGPVGIEAIAASLGEDKATLEDVVEPYLLKNGFIIRTPRGRIATELSYKHLKLPYNPVESNNLFSH